MTLRRKPPLTSAPRFIIPHANHPAFKMAKRLANIYKNMLRAEVTIYKSPYAPGIPVENQSVFSHFLKAAQIVLDEDGDPKMFLKAQFGALKWARKFPFPAMLHTTNARLRYMDYRSQHEDAEAKETTEADFFFDEFEWQARKLKNLAASTGLTEKKALAMYRKQFTRPFLRLRGVAK